jgi:hypothetical protein
MLVCKLQSRVHQGKESLKMYPLGLWAGKECSRGGDERVSMVSRYKGGALC